MMTALAGYLSGMVPALGWTLAHFLWQGALVAMVLEVLLKASRRAQTRHNLALGALLIMAALPVATFAWLQGGMRIVFVPQGFPGLATSHALTWEKLVVGGWLTGVALLAFRTAGGLLLVERLRQGATPLPAAWAARCRRLRLRMAGSLGVVFAQSEAIAAPLVAGWLKPMVLIPAAALTRVPADQLEALILHELAHVRRLDAFANLIQAIVETALFYHPAVWWVSRRIRVEREHCCDDLAVGAVRDPVLYARALQTMEALRPAPSGVLAANGGELKARVARVLGLASAPERAALSPVAAVLILMAAAVVLTQGQAVKATPAPASMARESAPSAPVPQAAVTRPEGKALAQANPAIPGPTAEQQVSRIVLAEVATAPASPAPAALQPPVLQLAAAAPQPSTIQVASLGTVQAPPVVSPRVDPKHPDLKIHMQGSEDDVEQAVAIWPAKAHERQADGSATLRCFVDVHGLAESCKVASETPAGKRLGRAALELRSTFKLAPATGADGQPVGATMAIRVVFRAPSQDFDNQEFQRALIRGRGGFGTLDIPPTDNPILIRNEAMLDNPVWATAATFDDLAAAYPAKGGGVEGYAVAHCQVQRDGALTGCAIIAELPELRGFGHAALSLTPKFKVAAQFAATPHKTPLFVDVPIRMPPPGGGERTVMAPRWITGFDPNATPKLFPPEAVASGVTTGRGVARCIVAADGSLMQCAAETAEPAGLGFSQAAAKLASAMKMNLWSADGAPVVGGVVHIPVRLNLKGGA